MHFITPNVKVFIFHNTLKIIENNAFHASLKTIEFSPFSELQVINQISYDYDPQLKSFVVPKNVK